MRAPTQLIPKFSSSSTLWARSLCARKKGAALGILSPFLCVLLLFQGQPLFGGSPTLLLVASDTTRELFQEINQSFTESFVRETGEKIQISSSYGGSGKQARTILDGLPADLVSLALDRDVDLLVQAKLVDPDWQSRFPYGSHPFAPVIVFLVRDGNPKRIHDWGDLTRPGIQIITPNPKTSGAARWVYLAAFAYGLKVLGSESRALEFLRQLYSRVPVLDTGARGATLNFIERKLGDVYITWENEALLITRTLKPGEYTLVYPRITILAECPATWVDRVVEKKGTLGYVRAYLTFLFSQKGQEIVASHGFRPRDPQVLARFSPDFPEVKAVTLSELYQNWEIAHKVHFAEGGVFDSLLKKFGEQP